MKKQLLYLGLVGLMLPFFGFRNPSDGQQDKPKEKGFKKIFDGKSLKGWEGDPAYWRVENGSIVGEITPATVLKRNHFLIWRGGQPADFEFKADVKITKAGNTGVNYRSEELLPDIPYALKGYQADIDGSNRYTGQNYEERARTTLAYRGEISVINEQTDPELKNNLRTLAQRNNWTARQVKGSLGHTDSLKTSIKSEDWNELHIVAKGNHLLHYINGILMSDVTDLDKINGKASGWLGMQVHVGPPMKVEYKNIRLKTLK